jgi:hypothetical protein
LTATPLLLLSRRWGYGLSSVFGVILVTLLIVLLLGEL